ncbi:MAG TPA: WhiB family transcriptional regulator [Acidimicrobiales bacterium]|nr:WhiB family transcriptional regulator [Acidimicrobiales bacterium]
MFAPEITTPTIDWMLEATCRNEGIPTSLFFSEDLGEIAQAKAICATCPAMVPCLEGAIARAEPWGVWGGQLLLNGKVLAVKRRRGRPRKHPRPEDEVPMLPVPEHLSAFVRSA